jgi:hypothetical protein
LGFLTVIVNIIVFIFENNIFSMIMKWNLVLNIPKLLEIKILSVLVEKKPFGPHISISISIYSYILMAQIEKISGKPAVNNAFSHSFS